MIRGLVRIGGGNSLGRGDGVDGEEGTREVVRGSGEGQTDAGWHYAQNLKYTFSDIFRIQESLRSEFHNTDSQLHGEKKSTFNP